MKLDHKISFIIPVILAAMIISGCKKDGKITGGSLADPHVNLSTYDYLKTNPLFDTLVLLIDKAGLRDTLNSGITFFAPTDYSIKELMDRRSDSVRIRNNNENLTYNLDSFNVSELRDSLKAYMFKASIKREALSITENNFYNNLVDEPFSVRLSETLDYTSNFINTRPKYMFLFKIVNGVDPDDNSNVPIEDRDQRMLLQTTGILTTTGVLHVINNYHIFYWD